MAAVVPVASLNDTLHCIKLRVRVVRIWQGRGNNDVVNFVLLDSQGGAIQGNVAARDYRKFRVHLAEGRLCELARFTVGLRGAIFCAVRSHEFSISLTRDSTVYPLSDPSLKIPLHYFELVDLEEVGVSRAASTDLMDVVARIVGFGPVQSVQGNAGLTRVATLFIANERGFLMDVALWEDFIDKFDVPAIVARSADSPVVVACNSLQLREFQARWCLKTFVGTRFHFDESIPEIAAFRSRLPPDQPPVFNDGVGAAQCMSRLKVLPVVRQQNRKMTLLQLAEAHPVSDSEIFECVAEIADVITRHDWYYLACPGCNRKLHDPDKRPICDNSKCSSYKSRVIPVPWYRFTVRVNDETASSRFVLLGRQAEIVVGPRAATVASEPNPNPDDCPPALLQIIGRRFMFAVSARDAAAFAKFRSYTVQRVDPVPPEHPVLLLPRPDNPAVHGTASDATPATESALSVDTALVDASLGPPVNQSDTPGSAGILASQPYLAVAPQTVPDQLAALSSLPVKRMPSPSSGSRVVDIRNVKRRLDFALSHEGQQSSDVAGGVSSPSKEETA